MTAVNPLYDKNQSIPEQEASLKKIAQDLKKKTENLEKKEKDLLIRSKYFERKVSYIMESEDEMQKNLAGILSKSQHSSQLIDISRISDDFVDSFEHLESTSPGKDEWRKRLCCNKTKASFKSCHVGNNTSAGGCYTYSCGS